MFEKVKVKEVEKVVGCVIEKVGFNFIGFVVLVHFGSPFGEPLLCHNVLDMSRFFSRTCHLALYGRWS